MKSVGKTLILLVLVLIISQSIFVVLKTYQAVDDYKKTIHPTAKASGSGIVAFCINAPPIINISDCSSTGTQNVYYECWVNATDPDNNNLTYSLQFTLIDRAFSSSNNSLFNIGPDDGEISFTPDNDDVGNYTVIIMVNDGVGCDNSQDSDTLNLEIINVNDAPLFILDIDDLSFSEEDEVIHAFYLDNHFTDPDNDELNYSYSITNSDFSIQINNITGLVTVTAEACDTTAYVIFSAVDPYNETNSSNLIRLDCNIETVPDEGGDGSGGGGGGGSGIQEICIPEYSCYDYYRCNISNVKVQKCVDTEGCENDIFLEVPCKYSEELFCNETWNCTEWGPCLPNRTQTRLCTDLNNCGLELNKPDLVQECEYIGTCDDGIKNCHDGSCEEGVDCGGPCNPCKSIQVPYPFEEEKNIFIYILTGIILLILTSILLYHYFRKEINAALARAGWIISGRKKKQILLSPEDKKKLLQGIADLEKKMSRYKLYEILIKFSELIRYYMIKASGPGLTPEFDLEELEKVLHQNKKRVREILRKIFVSTFSGFLKIEQNKDLITKANIVLLIEELRNLVLQTSKTTADDVAREIKEFKPPEEAKGVEKIFYRIINTYIALEFLELGVAKKKYLEILPEYEKLDIGEQEAVFDNISRLYHNITYVNTWLGKVKE